MWLAYVFWKPEMSFKDFLDSDSTEEQGVYIDQLGF
jgi:hypothetical protein